MATNGINSKKLKPAELVKLLNSTDYGTVISMTQIYRHFSQAGYRVASPDDSRCLHLYRYIAWLVDRKAEQAAGEADAYEAHRAAAAQRQADISAAGRDIGELPAVQDPARKEACRHDFKLFCEKYFPEVYQLAWSADHLRAIDKIQKSVLDGGLFALAMSRGSGKALDLHTPLPTPSGWTTMGEVEVGDELFDERGHVCRVVGKSPVYTGHDCYRVEFNDGSSVVCDAGHLWTVEDIRSRRGVRTETAEWLSTRYAVGKRGWNECRFRIPMQKPLDTPCADLPVAPYALGVWLGDGCCSCSAVSLFDEDVEEIRLNVMRDEASERLQVDGPERGSRAMRCRLTAYPRGGKIGRTASFQARLRALGLLDDKHIPAAYLRASVAQRRALLQGIMDTDGHVSRDGACEICIKYPKLAAGFGELLSSLGIRFSVGEKTVMLGGKEYGPYKRFYVSPYADDEVFQLRRKAAALAKRPAHRWKADRRLWSHGPREVRTITRVERVPSVPTQCVVVDSPSHLYLCGPTMVPTHNSSLTETAAIWSMVYGHREFVVLIGASESAALEILDSIKTELEVNEHLAADFPEVTYPIACLDGIANRCAGQLYKGERTRITWTANEIVLPTIAGAASSGVLVRVAGITGRIRGMKFKKPDGRTIRPEFVVVDDPQTSESAGSLEQTRKRVRVLAGDILGLAGPGKKISGIMPCTVIRPGDMAEQILDKSKHPEWNGERCKMLYQLPRDEELWNRYADLRADELREKGTFEAATEFYRRHQAEMDAGAVVSWTARYNYDEISAVQHAMNLKLMDEAAFWAEYQNEPLPEDLGTDEQLTVDGVVNKLNGRSQGTAPASATHLTMFVDVQKTLLYYVVCAWDDDFTGSVVDYGAWPEQRRRFFYLADANPTLQAKFPRAGLEGCLYSGLKELTDAQLGREFPRDDGAVLRIERCLVDANWGQSTDVVYQFCRESAHANVIVPSHGKYIGASSKPMSEYKKCTGDRVGHNWRMPNIRGKRTVRHVVFDANYWKSFVASRLLTSMGDRGCLSLWGRSSEAHMLFAEHLTAEYRVKTEGRGRRVEEWKMRPDAHDNHWFDGVVGCAVAASMCGCVLEGTDVRVQAKPKVRVKLSELRKTRR